ncbi:hypothetical protein Pmani_031474 [Petrolisthes manimaculis]|uniref:Uncharacterized protein n=1 Tax=Petrolisthes manimaculis TaxID=1843537 RepID=A0AAE1NVA9_9EUCA|nr:hypothetical protein Pmani_031474 [Petrolisthes manimaculis]
MTMNLAQMFGPVVGGALLELGGFKLPFLVMGTVQMSMTFLSLGLPRDSTDMEDDVKNYREVKIWKIFTVRGIWVSFLTFIFSTMSNGFLSITLEPQVIRTFGYSSLYVGLLFGLKDGANSLASPLWGWVCDRNRKVKIFILWASCFAFTSFFLLGPFPGVPINRTIGVVIASLVLNGVGIGGQQVAGVVDAMREAVSAGFPESADTHGCVAGLWASLSGIGRFTSRTGSGFLVDVLGFRKASVFVVSLHGFVVVMTATYLAVWGDLPYTRKRRGDGDDSSDEDDDRRSWDVKAGMSRILTTTPADPVTTKTVNINIPTYGEDFEDSLFCGSGPMSYKTKYERSSPSGSPRSQEVV